MSLRHVTILRSLTSLLVEQAGQSGNHGARTSRLNGALLEVRDLSDVVRKRNLEKHNNVDHMFFLAKHCDKGPPWGRYGARLHSLACDMSRCK